MIYKKRARVYVNDENAKCVLTETQRGKIIAAITDDANDDIASITSFVHTTTSFLNGEKSCEVTEIKAINNIYTMFRLQKFYYESLHRLGFRYMWMETSNHKLVEAAANIAMHHFQDCTTASKRTQVNKLKFLNLIKQLLWQNLSIR